MRMRRPTRGVAAALVVAGPKGVYSCGSFAAAAAKQASCQLTPAQLNSVSDVVLTNAGDLWIGSSEGLFYVAKGSSNVSLVSAVDAPVLAVAFDEDAQTPVASGVNLWRRLADGVSWYMVETPGIVDDPPSGLEFALDNTLWITNDVCVNQHFLQNFTFHRLGGYEGLPTSNLTSIAVASSGAIWIGSLQGAMRYAQGAWKYFYGSRWLPTTQAAPPGNSVASVTVIDVDGQETGIVATDGGLSIIRYQSWTLESKAAYLQSVVYPLHTRYGLICEADMSKFGDVRTAGQYSADNDGLWTAVYVASQSFRYAVTKDPAVKQLAWQAFEAMEFLNNVTGIDGLMARSVLKKTDPPPTDGKWYNSTVFPEWIWKGDTSSDEVVGHMFAYPLIHDLVAETPEERGRAARLINNTLTYIVNNGYYLIDADGNHTTWGVWAPKELNSVPSLYDDRGVNSLQIMAWLLSGVHITGNPLFQTAFDSLVTKYGYGLNMINTKITQPSDDNYSDDELTFLPYYTWIHSGRPDLHQEFTWSIKRAYEISLSEHAAPWNFIYGATGAQDVDIAGSAWMLRTFPLDQIDWPFDNSNRLDVETDRNLSREGLPQLRTLLPYDEIFMGRWNGSPFDPNGGSGMSLMDGTAFLMPYWLGRYHGFITQAV
eukprot:TRINITY_DN3293_c0_g2_i1.p2 TRINITY_DN3293_c0_g2~~TRINITY_DN3293_c0_g2_i1.p2  ORF type:complete len:654 (+),score=269.04 TRINITY_DN3293_c0_g2_i1:3242-5203(+)